MTNLMTPSNSYGIPAYSTDFEDVFAYWEKYWDNSLGHSSFYPGIVDFEEGEISGGSSKPSFPTKGIYPNKNMEKSKMFYGVRGVRRIAALFKTRVDTRYPRVVLDGRVMSRHFSVTVLNQDTGKYQSVEKIDKGGIFYLATVDNFDKVEWWRTTNNGAAWQKICDDSERVLYPIYDRTQYAYPTPNNYSSILSQHLPLGAPNSDDEKSLAYGSLPSNINLSTLLGDYGGNLAECAMKCRVYKGNVWAESDIIYANGTIEKNPSPKLTPPVISVQFVPYQGIRAVKELKPPTINLSLETDTAFARTEEIAPLSLSLALESPQITRAVLELRPPLISLEVEAVERITRTEGHRTKPEITVNYSTVADVKTVSEAILPKPSIIGVDGGKTETVTVVNYAPTPELSVSITREDAVGTVAVPIYPEPLIIGVDGGKTETVTVSQVTA